MSEVKVGLSQEALNNPQESIQSLIEASNAIANASEKDFENMKNTKWYKRLWKMITFSKDNQKVMANGISNLAKLQEIVMKALLQLSEQHTELAEIVNNNSEALESLCNKVAVSSKQQYAMLVQLNRIKSGIEKNIFVDDLSGDSRIIVINAIIKIADEIDSSDDLSKKYISRLMATAEFTSADIQNDIDFSCIEDLKNKEAQLLYRLCKEYIYISTGNFDYDSEILEYINVNRKKAIAIENQIMKLIKIAGYEALLNGFVEETYDYVLDEYIEYEDIIEGDNAECNEDLEDCNGKLCVDMLETVVITNIKHINKNEKLVYEKKIIYVASNIACEGDVEFRDCVVVYNDNSYNSQGGIRLAKDSSLKAFNTSFVCKGKSDKAFIINDSDSIGGIIFEKCLFFDCSKFIELGEYSFCSTYVNIDSFKITDSIMHNISHSFINVVTNKNDICMDNVCIVQDKVKDYNSPDNESTVFTFVSADGNVIINNLSLVETDAFRSKIIEQNKKKCNGDENIIYCENYFKFGVGYSGKSVISNSKFVNVINVVEGATGMENCIFENCKNVFSEYPSENIEINNCVFKNCSSINYGEILKMGKGKMAYCRFIDCSGPICNSHYNEVVIEYCEFIGCSNFDKDSAYDPEIMIKLTEKKSKIKNCVFECVDAKDGFVIGGFAANGDEGIKVMVEDCEFINCASKRESKKLIKQYDYYLGMFNKRKEVKVVDVRNSKGWENVTSNIGKYDITKYNDGKAKEAGCLDELHNFCGILSLNYEQELIDMQDSACREGESEKSNLNVSNLLSFMRVEDCFVITGRGLVATGRVERGPFKVGDDVLWEKGGITKCASIVGIEKFRQLLDEAQPGEEIGM